MSVLTFWNILSQMTFCLKTANDSLESEYNFNEMLNRKLLQVCFWLKKYVCGCVDIKTFEKLNVIYMFWLQMAANGMLHIAVL